MITHTNQLTELQLVKIMSETKNNLVRQYRYLFGLDGIELEVTNSARLSIAKKAMELKTNARGLKNIFDTILLPYQFDSAEMKKKGVVKLQITEDVVDKGADPVLVFKKEKGKIAQKN